MSRFMNRLMELGFATYADYLASDHWREFKERYRSSGRSLLCAVCSCKPIQLHHHTYKRLGCEKLEDVTPLCRDHHNAVHDWLKANCHNFVDQTDRAIAFLRGEPLPAKVKKNKPSKKQRAALRKQAKARKLEQAKQARLAPTRPADRLTPLIAQLRELLLTSKKKVKDAQRKCDNVIRCNDEQAIRHLIEKFGGTPVDGILNPSPVQAAPKPHKTGGKQARMKSLALDRKRRKLAPSIAWMLELQRKVGGVDMLECQRAAETLNGNSIRSLIERMEQRIIVASNKV